MIDPIRRMLKATFEERLYHAALQQAQRERLGEASLVKMTPEPAWTLTVTDVVFLKTLGIAID